MILIARGWQMGPSQVLPPSCRYQPSCSAYAITAIQRYGAARGRLDGAQAHLPLPPLGRPGPRPGTVRGSRASERQQESDPRGRAERARAARLDLGREQIFPDRQPAEHEGRERQAAAAARSRRRSRPRRHAPKALQTARPVLARDAARRDPHALARRARSTSRARRSTICCWSRSSETIEKNSPPVRLLSPLGAPGAYFAEFGWTGQGAQAPDARHGLDRRRPAR